MKKQLTIKDFNITKSKTSSTPIITWSNLELKMGKKEYDIFMKWMFGQGAHIDGVWKWDLERYLKGKDTFQ